MKIKPVFHHYKKWEETDSAMWKKVYGDDRKSLLEKAIEFTGDAELYGSFMLKVLDEWPFSCEQHLSHVDVNRQAWIGHAACCIALDCPEDITREAWHYLTREQQDAANAKADEAIAKWEEQCRSGQQVLTF